MDQVTYLIASVQLMKMWCQNLRFFLFQHVMIHQGWEATDDNFFYSLISFRLLCTTDDFSIFMFLLGNILRLLPWVMAFSPNCSGLQWLQLWLYSECTAADSKVKMAKMVTQNQSIPFLSLKLTCFLSIKQLELDTERLLLSHFIIE